MFMMTTNNKKEKITEASASVCLLLATALFRKELPRASVAIKCQQNEKTCF